MNPGVIPSPQHFPPEVMLPFSRWPVADLIDGKRSVSSIARHLGVNVGVVMQSLQAIEQELGVTLASGAELAVEDTAGPTAGQLLAELTLSAVETMGPMGEVIVEDALDELGDGAPAAVVITRVAQELREPQRSAFLGRLRTKGLL